MLYIFDIDEQLQAVLNNDGEACPYSDPIHAEKLNGENTFSFSIPADHSDAQYVTEGNLVAFEDLDLAWQLFEIKRVTDLHGDGLTKTAFCENAFYELIDDFIEDVRPTDCSANFALTQALSGTRWEPGTVADLGTNSTNYYYQSVLSSVQKVASVWGGELRFRIVVTGGVIANRYVDLLTRRGTDTGKQWEYGRHTKEIEREIDLTTTKTALYGRGKGEAVETGGYGRRTTFADVVWSTASGDPVDKPAGQEWVGDPAALALWGRDGGSRHRFGKFEDAEETDPETLLEKTWEALQELNTPRATYRMSVIDLERLSGYSHEKVRLGDTTRVIDRKFSPALKVSARVIEIHRDLVRPENTQVVLGNFAPSLADNALSQQQVNQTVGDRQGVWDKATAFDPDTGKLDTSWLNGIIDILTNQLRAATTNFYTDANGAFIWEDATGTAAMKIVGGQFALSNEKDVGGDWIWRTFGTGDGFTADELNAGEINTSLIQITGNSYFYWDGDYLYIINPSDANEQIRLSKEGIRFTQDGGTNWNVAIDFDGIRMVGTSGDGKTEYGARGVKVYDGSGNLFGHLGTYEYESELDETFTRATTKYKSDGTEVSSGTPTYEAAKFSNGVHTEEATTTLTLNPSFETFTGTADDDTSDTVDNWTAYNTGTGREEIVTDSYFDSYAAKVVQTGSDATGRYRGFYQERTLTAMGLSAGDIITAQIHFKMSAQTNSKVYAGLNYYDASNNILSITRILNAKTSVTSTFTKATVTDTIPANTAKIRFDFFIRADGAYSGQNNWLIIDGFGVEEKAYATSFHPSTRNADSLYYDGFTLPDEWFRTGVWKPDQDSTIDRTKNLYLTDLYNDSNNKYWVAYYTSDDKLKFIKNYQGTLVVLASVALAFSAGDVIEWGAMQLTQAWGDLAAGMHLWYRIDGGSVVHLENTDTNLPTAPTKDYIGCTASATDWNGNGAHDAGQLIDIQSEAALGTAINNAWAESFLTAASAPTADAATLLLANFDDTLTAIKGNIGYGLWTKNGRYILQDPVTGQGLEVWDGTTRKVLVGKLDDGTIGQEIVGGKIYATTFSTRQPGEVKAFAELLTNGDFKIFDITAALGLLITGGNGQGEIVWYLNGLEYANALINAGSKDLWFRTKQANSGYDFSTYNGCSLEIDSGGDGDAIIDLGSVELQMYGSGDSHMYVDGYFVVHGGFDTIGGSKDAVEKTENYGLRRLAAEEGPDVRYTIKGYGQLVDGQCRIDIDPIFLECIEPNIEQSRWAFQLTPMFEFLNMKIAEVGSAYFIVQEKDSLSGHFCWEMSAIRKGFAGRWLEKAPYDDEIEELITGTWEDELLSGVETE